MDNFTPDDDEEIYHLLYKAIETLKSSQLPKSAKNELKIELAKEILTADMYTEDAHCLLKELLT